MALPAVSSHLWGGESWIAVYYSERLIADYDPLLFSSCTVPRAKSRCWNLDSVALSAGKSIQVGIRRWWTRSYINLHTLLVQLFSLSGILKLCVQFLKSQAQWTMKLAAVFILRCVRRMVTPGLLFFLYTLKWDAGRNCNSQQKSYLYQKNNTFHKKNLLSFFCGENSQYTSFNILKKSTIKRLLVYGY